MLSAQTYGNFKNSFDLVVNLLGVSADYTCVKDNTNSKVGITVGFSSSKTDTTLVQSQGINSAIITCKVADFTNAPAKFDRFVINTQTFVADSVHKVHLNGRIIGYRIQTQGK